MIGRRATVALLLVLVPTVAHATNLGTAAAGLAPGQWVEVSTSNIAVLNEASGSMLHILRDASYILWDGNSRRWHFIGADGSRAPRHVYLDDATDRHLGRPRLSVLVAVLARPLSNDDLGIRAWRHRRHEGVVPGDGNEQGSHL
jgi:hypothetical protein